MARGLALIRKLKKIMRKKTIATSHERSTRRSGDDPALTHRLPLRSHIDALATPPAPTCTLVCILVLLALFIAIVFSAKTLFIFLDGYDRPEGSTHSFLPKSLFPTHVRSVELKSVNWTSGNLNLEVCTFK